MIDRVMNCPLRDCDGRAVVTYRASLPDSSSKLKIITDIACDSESCLHFVASEQLVERIGHDPRRVHGGPAPLMNVKVDT